MHYRTSFICLTFIIITNIQAGGVTNTLRTLCSKLFGTQPVTTQLAQQVKQARADYEIADQSAPINYIRPGLWSRYFTSFTWFGSWFNQEDMQKMDENEKTWQTYHEVAHEKLGHPVKQLVLAIGSLGLGSTLARVKSPLFLIAAVCAVGLPNLIYQRQCEKNADITAAKKLIALNKKSVVQAHIEELQQSSHPSGIMKVLFPSTHAQIKYLKEILNA